MRELRAVRLAGEDCLCGADDDNIELDRAISIIELMERRFAKEAGDAAGQGEQQKGDQ